MPPSQDVQLPDISEAREIFLRFGARPVQRAEVTLDVEILEVPPLDESYQLLDALDMAGFDLNLTNTGASYVNRLGGAREFRAFHEGEDRTRTLMRQGQTLLSTTQSSRAYGVVGAKPPENRVPKPLEKGFYDVWLGDLWEVLEPALDEETQEGLVCLVQVPFHASMMEFARRHQYELESRSESIGRDAQSFVTTDLMRAARIIKGSRLISHHMSCASIYEEGAKGYVVTESPALCVHLKKVPGLEFGKPVALAIPGVAYMRSDGGIFAREGRDEMERPR